MLYLPKKMEELNRAELWNYVLWQLSSYIQINNLSLELASVNSEGDGDSYTLSDGL